MGASERSAVLGNLAIVPRTRSAREALACI